MKLKRMAELGACVLPKPKYVNGELGVTGEKERAYNQAKADYDNLEIDISKLLSKGTLVNVITATLQAGDSIFGYSKNKARAEIISQGVISSINELIKEV